MEETRRLSVLQIVQGFPPEFVAGTELYCQALTRALQDRGHRCFVLAGSNQPAKAPALVTTEEEGIGVTRYMSPLSPFWREWQIDPYNPEAELLIRQYLETIRPDVVHVHHWLRLTNTVVAAAETLGIPTVVTLHDLWTSCVRIHRQHRLGYFCQDLPSPSLCLSCVERTPWQEDNAVRQAVAFRQEQIAVELHLARALLVPSEPHRQLLSRLMSIPLDRLHVVPHGALTCLAPRSDNGHPRFPHRRLRLAYWGYLVRHKGVHLLLEAVRQLRDPHAVEVYLAGLAPEAPYLEYLRGLAEGLDVTFAGEYQPADLTRLDVDLAVFPSLAYESYGFVLDEALQLGLPAIVSDRGALGARVGEAGLVFAAGDASALARRIQEILDTPPLLEAMRQQVAARVPLSMDEHVRVIEAVYQDALRSPSRQPGVSPPSALRRLAFFHTRLAAREQEVLDFEHTLRQQAATLEQKETVIARQESELRQKGEELRLAREKLWQRGEELRQTREELQQRDEEVRQKDADIARLHQQLHEWTVKGQALEAWVDKISRSVGWRLLNRFYYVRENLIAPPGTRRGKLYDLLKRTGVTYANDGVGGVIQKTRERLEDAVTPDPYQLWLARHTPGPEEIRRIRAEVQAFAYQPLISIVMPVYNTEERWLRQAIESVRGQFYPHWELCICDDGSTADYVPRILAEYSRHDERIRVVTNEQNKGISAASNRALSITAGEFVGFLDHDDELTPDALYEVVKLLNERPELDFLYTDEDKLASDGRREEPFFKPDWSPDLLLSMNYIAHFAVVRRRLLQEVGGFTEGLEGSQDYDLFLRLSEKTGNIGHIAKPLYSWRKSPHSTALAPQAKPYAHEAGRQALQQHLRRRGVEAEVVDGLVSPFRYRVRYRIIGQPLVSIIIPIKDRVDLLRRCLESVEEKTTYRHFEVVIVDNGSEKPDTLEYLAHLSHRVIRLPGPFNYSYLNNVGVAHAQGEFVLFLNNDIEVIAEEWLEALLEQAQRQEVGAVGAKLLFPRGTIQHAGVILGHSGFANNAFWGQPGDRPLYYCLSHVVRNYSAVTGACLMTRRAVFEAVGGFDENLTVAFGDVDLCLRIREKGYSVVYTPYAVLYHLESATRKKLHPMADEEYARKRWGRLLAQGDPYYNPHLSLERFDFSLRVLDQGASKE